MPVELSGPGGTVLEYAIYHSPLAFIRALLEHGAGPNPPPHIHAGFPPLLAALSWLGSAPGSTARPDVRESLSMPLAVGADPNQRGLTPLHMAVAARSLQAVRILLEAGSDEQFATSQGHGNLLCEGLLHGSRRLVEDAERLVDIGTGGGSPGAMPFEPRDPPRLRPRWVIHLPPLDGPIDPVGCARRAGLYVSSRCRGEIAPEALRPSRDQPGPWVARAWVSENHPRPPVARRRCRPMISGSAR